MGISLNGGIPKTPQKWWFLVGNPWLLGATILGNPQMAPILKGFPATIFPAGGVNVGTLPTVGRTGRLKQTGGAERWQKLHVDQSHIHTYIVYW